MPFNKKSKQNLQYGFTFYCKNCSFWSLGTLFLLATNIWSIRSTGGLKSRWAAISSCPDDLVGIHIQDKLVLSAGAVEYAECTSSEE